MGLAALRKILAPVPFDPVALRGRTVAVDANNMIWSFVTALAGAGARTSPEGASSALAAGADLPRGPDGRSNAHLIGLLNRLELYAKWGARSIWVFDGAQPDLKEATLVARAARIEAARVAGNALGSVEVTDADFDECGELLTALGVPWLVAPGESDAQCAHLVRAGAAWAAVTQDWDIALFGAPRALRNLTGSKTRAPELLDLAAALAAAGLTREALVDAAILIGTDYNEGVRGVGPVKALKLVKAHGPLDRALAALKVDLPDAAKVQALYFSHPVDATWAPEFRAPDLDRAIARVTASGLGERRARSVVDALRAFGSGAVPPR